MAAEGFNADYAIRLGAYHDESASGVAPAPQRPE
jgi:hypothetical protein